VTALERDTERRAEWPEAGNYHQVCRAVTDTLKRLNRASLYTLLQGVVCELALLAEVDSAEGRCAAAELWRVAQSASKWADEDEG
jgi:hypothetical protein